jgi:rhodanese-related sulfurtransferase
LNKTEDSRAGERLVRIFLVCVVSIALITGVAAWQSKRPSEGKIYERLTVEEALRFMSYEKDFIIVDIREEEEYAEGHLEGAVNIPYEGLVAHAMDLLPDMSRTVYVYGSTEQESCAAAQKLSDMGYTGVSEIGAYGDWITAQSETESLMEGLLD